MPLPNFESLYASADRLPGPVPVVAAGGADPTVIEALVLALQRGWVQPILTGDPERIAAVAQQMGADLSGFTVLPDSVDSSAVAVQAVRSGRARLLMKGQISTPALMQGILNRESGLRTGRTIGQIVLMEIPRDSRSFLLADTGVTIAPTRSQKQELLQSLVTTAHSLGCTEPRVAIMSATEKATDALPDTLDAVDLARQAAQGAYGTCQVEGPLSFDLAYAADASRKKGITGEVTGAADAMLFPNLLSANLTVKGIMYTADCRFGGVLCGTSCPVVFMSRADAVSTRLNSLAYALRLLQQSPELSPDSR